ncbi:MAG: sigma-54-dependent Fis family transcriptional regulator [Spirochaetes bacterium]|nr:sigma-54-dependent Fis family transcriptional regulator [Spirochaetota bacterium]
MATLLIADDEKNIREGLARALKMQGHKILLAEDGEAAFKHFLTHKTDLAIVDIKMPGLSGLELLARIKATADPCPVIFLTGHGSVETAVEAMRLGAWDFMTKPVNLDKLELLVEHALKDSVLENQNRALVVRVREYEVEKILLGRSKAIRDIIERIKQVAPSKATVYVYGESGTGKELIADALHHFGGGDRPFIKVHCAALTPNLLESELFGHEKGAFTGADARKIGRFEAASGGTLFLDEVSEIPKETQVKLLRVLQERVIERVGSHESIPVDLRLVAASNKPLEEEVKAGRFREDLFYRLNVIDIKVPPLRERRGDIAIMVRHFLDLHSRANQKNEIELTGAALTALENYAWPGNVRELGNLIEKLVVLSTTGKIALGDLPESFRGGASGDAFITIPLGTPMEEVELRVIEETIRWCGGNKSEAAKILGLGRKTVHRKLAEDEAPPHD